MWKIASTPHLMILNLTINSTNNEPELCERLRDFSFWKEKEQFSGSTFKDFVVNTNDKATY